MSFKAESPLDFDLHKACRAGDATWAKKILDTGRVHVDTKVRFHQYGIHAPVDIDFLPSPLTFYNFEALAINEALKYSLL